MNHISRRVIICGLLAMNLLGLSYAAEQLDKDTLETLIKGNTVEGRKIKWKTTYRMYFDPSGKFQRIDSLNNKEGGEWHVERDGKLRMTGRKEKYRTVKQRSDGGYDVYNRRGQVIWTMDKVSPGNPYNLIPK
jgi:hypothetical protein